MSLFGSMAAVFLALGAMIVTPSLAQKKYDIGASEPKSRSVRPSRSADRLPPMVA
jgi:hypothetical protein